MECVWICDDGECRRWKHVAYVCVCVCALKKRAVSNEQARALFFHSLSDVLLLLHQAPSSRSAFLEVDGRTASSSGAALPPDLLLVEVVALLYADRRRRLWCGVDTRDARPTARPGL